MVLHVYYILPFIYESQLLTSYVLAHAHIPHAHTSSNTHVHTAHPQPILELPLIVNLTNTSSTLTWTFPGGEVDFYFIMVMGIVYPKSFNVTINGTETFIILGNLDPATTYGITIVTVNSLGYSIASPIILFTTKCD